MVIFRLSTKNYTELNSQMFSFFFSFKKINMGTLIKVITDAKWLNLASLLWCALIDRQLKWKFYKIITIKMSSESSGAHLPDSIIIKGNFNKTQCKKTLIFRHYLATMLQRADSSLHDLPIRQWNLQTKYLVSSD